MTPDTLTATAAMILQREQRVNDSAGKLRTPAADIASELYLAVAALIRLAEMADMQFARNEREMHEEASAFSAYLMEIARPLDVLLRNVMAKAGDNVGVGGFSKYEADDLEKARIVTDALHDNWLGYFQLAAIGAALEPEEYSRRYARQIELAGRK